MMEKTTIGEGQIKKKSWWSKTIGEGQNGKKVGAQGTFIGLIVHSHFRGKMEEKNGGPWLLLTHILEAKSKKE